MRDAARTKQKDAPEPCLRPKQGWVAVQGRGYWPLSCLVAPEDLPAEGRIGPILVKVTDEHEGAKRHRVLSLKRLVDVHRTPPDTDPE